MPYKIVKTFEKGNSKLSAVPSNWEKDGVLHWPRYNENKLRRVENSCPENNWRKINCKVKRSNLITFLEAEQEIDKMCDKSETETETEQYYVTKQKEITFNELVQDCIMLPLEETLCLWELVAFTMIFPSNDPAHSLLVDYLFENISPAPDSNTQQNVATEIQIDNTVSFELTVLSKLESLQENYKTLNEKVTENIKAQEDQRKFMNESIESILLGLSNVTVQFEHIINQFNRAENLHKSNIQTITSEHELNKFEKELEHPDIANEWKEKLSIICGKEKGRGINNAYALVDTIFSRSFLLQCSWAGGSRSSEQKICFKSHTKIINLFFDIINESDNTFSLLDCHKFFKNILKNSRQRNESKLKRTSTTKNRPQIKAKRRNLSNETPITVTSGPNISAKISLPAPGTSGSDSENCSSVAGMPLETSV